MMKISNELKAGIFAATTLFLLVLVVLVMGRERRIFSDASEYKVIFSDVKGLAAGAPVRLGGLTIGRVGSISFSENASDPKVYVKLLVDEEFADRVRVDSNAIIETQGLLGDRFITLSPGSSQTPLPPGGDVIPLERPDIAEVLTGVSKVVSNSAEITDKLKSTIDAVNPETVEKVADSMAAVSEMIRDVKSNKGILYRLIYSEKEGDEISKGITSVSRSLSRISDQAASGPGLVHTLFFDPEGNILLPRLLQALSDIGKSAESIAAFVDMVSSGDGPLTKLFIGPSENGTEPAKDLSIALQSLRVTLKNFERASILLSQGSGTLGALLLDPRIYDSLLELTENANRSIFLRQVVRSTLDE